MNMIAIDYGLAHVVEGYGTNEIKITGPTDSSAKELYKFTKWTQQENVIKFNEEKEEAEFINKKLLNTHSMTKEEFDSLIDDYLVSLASGTKSEGVYLKFDKDYINYWEFKKNV